MKLLVTGADGQLGQSLAAVAGNFPQLELVFKNRKGLDITDFNAVSACIAAHNITAVINCAAYTAVDKAETEKEKAMALNKAGVKNIVDALCPIKGKLIHLSTDYVFDGNGATPYVETQQRNPQSVYGKTKMEGEEIVMQANLDALVVRTSWVFSAYGNNFLKTMLRLLENKERITVVNDQIGRPTYAPYLAETLLRLIGTKGPWPKERRCYHFAQRESCSWFSFAQEIQRLSGLRCELLPVTTKEFPTAAPRPRYSVLSTAKIEADHEIEIVSWKTALKACMQSLNLPL